MASSFSLVTTTPLLMVRTMGIILLGKTPLSCTILDKTETAWWVLLISITIKKN